MKAMDETFLRYNALDSACTLEIHNKIWDDVGNEFAPAYKMTVDLFPVLMFMQTRGVKVSHDLLDQTKIEVLASAKEKQEELDKLCGHHLNVNSPKQCVQYFYITKGISPYFGKGKSPTVDDKALQRMVRGTAKQPGLREAKLVQEIRGLEKLYGTYLNMQFDEDSRMRGSYNPRGTKFGRLSSSKTIFDTGMNFQNLPQEFKKFLVPDDGYVFLEVDKRQAEWVVVAYASGDANMIAAIEAKTDVHLHTASLMFNADPDIVKLDNKMIGHITDAEIIAQIRYEDPILRKYTQGFPRAMSARQCGKKCLTADTEVLTPSGWVSFDNLRQGTKIAQWKDGIISFVSMLELNKYQNDEELITLEANHVSQYVTPGHRILTVNDRTKDQRVFLAKDLKAKAHWNLPTSGLLLPAGNNITSDEIKLLVAIQADGSIDPYNNLILRVAKERKLKRGKEILDRLNVRYTETDRGFFIHRGSPSTDKVASLLGHNKLFGSYLMECQQIVMQAFIDEVPFWDGYDEKRQYFTTVKENALWVQTIAHLVGYRATVKERKPTGYGKKNLFWVKIGAVNNTSLVSIKKGNTNYTGYVYCPTVPSGFFLVRHKGKISVTGNSNHGLNYAETANGFALINEMTIGEAKEIVNLYHRIYPGIQLWYEAIKRQLQKDRSLTNCFGRKVRFMNLWCDDLFKSAYSMLPQSTVVDSLNMGMVDIYADDDITKVMNVDVLAQVHDSILMQVPISVLENEQSFNALFDKVTKYTSPGMNYNGRDFTIASDFKAGLNWGGANDKHNPTGMDDVTCHEDMMQLIQNWRKFNGSGTQVLA